MSFRHPFVTNFIYQASDETKDANPKVKAIFEEYTGNLVHSVDERGYGYYSGTFGSTGTYMEIHSDIEEMVYKLGKATKLGFQLTIMYESGPVVTYTIDPLN
jgi:hypothetical protein